MKISNSIWVDVRGKASIERFQLDKKEMEALFCEDPKAPKGKKKKLGANNKDKSNKPKVVSLLEHKRQQNIGIALAQFKCSLEELRLAILKMDTQVLDRPDALRARLQSTHACQCGGVDILT